jgi:hypothetical protein
MATCSSAWEEEAPHDPGERFGQAHPALRDLFLEILDVRH